MDKEIIRCDRANKHQLLQEYHDNVWGKPVYDDKKLFRMLQLESMQAGLSRLIILKKLEDLDLAFDGFDPDIIVNYDQKKEEKLLENKAIIRNRLKIKSVKANAIAYQKLIKEFGSFSDYLWKFVDYKPIVNKWESHTQIPTETKLSARISKDMKKRGFKFLGSKIIYAFIQAVGMVDDHLLSCSFKVHKD